MKLKVIFLIVLFLTFSTRNKAFAQLECSSYSDASLAMPEVNVVSTALGTALSQADFISFLVSGEDSCDAYTKAFSCIQDGTITTDCQLAPDGASGGTVIGLTGNLRAMANSDTIIPVNFAYYFRDQFRNVPIVGDRVYAQKSEDFQDIWAVSIVLSAWKVLRNMALGLLSIFLIVIGIFIIIRKKVDARTVITLQAALPKVIISMVLIVFSFFIGTTFIRLVPFARGVAGTIVDSAIQDSLSEDFKDFKLGVKTESIIAITNFSITGLIFNTQQTLEAIKIGIIAHFFGAIIALTSLIFYIIAYLKTILIYIKLMAGIVTAPFQFAYGALPGQDAMIINWFKKMTAYVIAIPLMYIMLNFAEYVHVFAIDRGMVGPNLNSASAFANTFFLFGLSPSGYQQLFLLMITPFLATMIMIKALGVPAKIEAMIVGEQKRG